MTTTTPQHTPATVSPTATVPSNPNISRPLLPTSTTTEPSQPSTTDQTGDTSTGTGSKKSDFGTSEIIGTVVGIAGLFVAVLTLYITWKRRKEKQLRSRGMYAQEDSAEQLWERGY